jgi:hypothetical protein
MESESKKLNFFKADEWWSDKTNRKEGNEGSG